MSRYNEWTSAYRGLMRFTEKHLEIDVHEAGRPHKHGVVEMGCLLNEFSRKYHIKGSRTERILTISLTRYKQWTEFIIAKAEAVKEEQRAAAEWNTTSQISNNF